MPDEKPPEAPALLTNKLVLTGVALAVLSAIGFTVDVQSAGEIAGYSVTIAVAVYGIIGVLKKLKRKDS